MQTGRIGRLPSSERQHKQQLLQDLANRRQQKYVESDTPSESPEGDSTSSAAAESASSEASVVDLSEQDSRRFPRKTHLPDISKLALTDSTKASAPEEPRSLLPSADPEAVQLSCPDSCAAAEGSEGADLLLHAPAAGKHVVLGNELSKRLYPHQVTGLKWLGGLYGKQRGGILGDDMGLGKVHAEVVSSLTKTVIFPCNHKHWLESSSCYADNAMFSFPGGAVDGRPCQV